MITRTVHTRRALQRGFLPAQSVRPTNGTRNTSVASRVAVAIVVTYLAAYMSQVRPVVDENLAVLLLPLLLISTYRYVCRPARSIGVVTITLVALVAYYFAVTQDPYWVRSLLGYVLVLAYCFSLTPTRTERGLRRIAVGLVVFFTISMATMVATLWSDSIASVRRQLFPLADAEIVQLMESGTSTDSEEMTQGGLKRELHAFGYQVAAGATFATMVALTAVGKRRWLWLPAAGLSLFVLLITGERSALLAVVGSLVTVGVIRRRPVSVLVVGAVVTTAVLVFLPQLKGISDVRRYNIFNRVDSSEQDFSDRVALQLWTVGEIARRPLGLYLDGVDYAAIAPIVNDNNILIAPHNGYLTRTLSFGWPVLVALLVLGTVVIRSVNSTCRAASRNRASDLEYVGLAAFGAAALNALFHNASIVTFQEETLVLLFFYLAVVRAREKRSLTRVAAADFRTARTWNLRPTI